MLFFQWWQAFINAMFPKSDNHNATLLLDTGEDKVGLGSSGLKKKEESKTKEKKYTKKKIKGVDVFVDQEVEEKFKQQNINVDDAITNTLKGKKEKKSKVKVEGNAKNLYTKEEWEKNFKK
jgi:post-segregation antitoxin (ccd killing protein)